MSVRFEVSTEHPNELAGREMIEIVLHGPHNRNSQNLVESSDTGDPNGMRCAVMRRFSESRRKEHPSKAMETTGGRSNGLLGSEREDTAVHGRPRHVLGGHDGQLCTAGRFGSESLQRESLRCSSFSKRRSVRSSPVRHSVVQIRGRSILSDLGRSRTQHAL